MPLNSQNIAMMAAALGDEIGLIARVLMEWGTVRLDVSEVELQKSRGAGA